MPLTTHEIRAEIALRLLTVEERMQRLGHTQTHDEASEWIALAEVREFLKELLCTLQSPDSARQVYDQAPSTSRSI